MLFVFSGQFFLFAVLFFIVVVVIEVIVICGQRFDSLVGHIARVRTTSSQLRLEKIDHGQKWFYVAKDVLFAAANGEVYVRAVKLRVN